MDTKSYKTYRRVVRETKAIAATLGVILLAVLAYECIILVHRVSPQVDTLLGTTNRIAAQTEATGEGVRVFLKKASADIESFTRTANISNETTAEIMQQTSALLIKADVNLFGGKLAGKEISGTLPELTALLRSSRNLLDQTSTDLHVLMGQTGDVLKPLEKSLNSVASLTDQLNKELKEGSPKVGQTLTDLDLAVKHLDELISDPNIKKMLDETAQTTHNLNETTKSVDIALRPLREKAKFVVTILKTALGMFKFTLPLGF